MICRPDYFHCATCDLYAVVKFYLKVFCSFTKRDFLIMISRLLSFFNFHRYRNNKYRIKTSMVEDDTGKYIVKVTDNDESMEFLQSIVQKEMLAKKHLLNHAEVIISSMRGNTLYNAYLDCRNLEELTAAAFNRGSGHYGESVVKDYVSFIQKLPCQECIPEEFMQEFEIPRESVTKPLRCLLFGPIDLIPRNILVDKSVWYIIDHEWTYTFPIPVDFIIYRGIHSLIVHLQQNIQLCNSPDHPLKIYAGYINKMYIPSIWLNILYSLQLPIQQFSYWEMLFQKKIIKNPRRGFLRI